jgi:hypothetical protein
MEHEFAVGQKWHYVLYKLKLDTIFVIYLLFTYIHSSREILNKNQGNLLVIWKQRLDTVCSVSCSFTASTQLLVYNTAVNKI